ncbi:hypothetical protein TRVA0_016S01464 [Trichomonascus vanleenenianus]|uniref:PQ-loop repeat-containing protein n=1 Tax=Trichomonascus vanleenenianus TaxID=2268995 RepID=UPI003EC973D9
MDQFVGRCPAVQDGLPLVKWIYYLNGSCVYGSLSAVSWVAGYISFFAWLGAQLPQVVVNYQNKSVEGLSWGFLVNWFAGDATNFLGCVLTGQMLFQTILAAYYCCIDIVLGSQYIYYSRRDRARRKVQVARKHYPASYSDGGAPDADAKTGPIEIPAGSPGARTNRLSPLITSSFLASFTKVDGAPLGIPSSPSRNPSAAQSVLSALVTAARIAATAAPPVTGPAPSRIALIGRVFAWICTFMYLTSRMPQIVKNFRRRSTWGTSMLLFFSALLGNVTYTISILLSPEARGPRSVEFLHNELPYLVGSAGTVVFDLTIFCQYFYFGNERTHYEPVQTTTPPNSDEDDEVPHHQYPNTSLIPSHAMPIAHKHCKDTTPLSLSMQTNYLSL